MLCVIDCVEIAEDGGGRTAPKRPMLEALKLSAGTGFFMMC